MTKSPEKIHKRLLKSPVVLLVALLVAAEYFAYNHTLNSARGLANNDDRTEALRQCIESKTNPDVVILGSSLTVTALSYPDFNLGLAPMNELNSCYIQSRLLDSLLKESVRKEFKTVNLSCLAATPADAYMLTCELFRRKKKPQILIYGIEPRAMADNLTPLGGALGGKVALELTPYYDSPGMIENVHLGAHRIYRAAAPAPVKMYVSDLNKKLGRLGENPKQEEVQNTLVSHFWHLYRVKNEIASLMQNKTEVLFSFRQKNTKSKSITETSSPKVSCIPQNLALTENTKTEQNKPWDTVSSARMKKQLVQYKVHYMPANQEKMSQNTEILKKMAELCKKNAVTLCLVKMPISKENQELVPAEIAQAYDANLALIAQKYDSILLDLRQGFESTDFMDTVHLNAKGGEKFQRKLVSGLQSAIQ